MATGARPAVLTTVLLAASLLIAVSGVFWIPWYVEFSNPVPGESYALGFNNRVAIVALGIALLVAICAYLVARSSPMSLRWLVDPVVVRPSWKVSRTEYIVVFVWSVVWAWLLWNWGSSLVDPAWCESRGFMHALDSLALGQLPYRDFMFNYGPVTWAVPYAITSLSQGDVSIEQAYLVTLVVLTVVGFGATFVLVQALELPGATRCAALVLGLAGWSQVSMGLNGVPLRFLVVPASIVLMHAVIRKRKAASRLDCLGASGAAAAAMFACTVMSPEMAIAGGLGVLAYAFSLWWGGARRLALASAVGCTSVVLIVALCGPAYFLSVLAFASGGGNFPVYPNAHNLALVAVAWWVIPRLIASALRQRSDHRAPLALGLAVAGGMLLPAALGRCDPGHVYFNGMLPFTMMFAVTAAATPWVRYAWWGIYGVLFIVLLQVSYWSYYANNFTIAMQMRAAYEQNPQLVDAWREKWDALRARHPRGEALHWSSVLPYPEELDDFTRQGPMLLLAGNEWNYWLARYLMLQQDLPPDYFNAYTQGAATPLQIERKVRECGEARFLIVPEFVLSPLENPVDLVAYGKSLDRFLSGLLFFPVRTTVNHPPYLPDSEIAKQLLEKFRPVHRYQGYVVLERKAPLERTNGRTITPVPSKEDGAAGTSRGP